MKTLLTGIVSGAIITIIILLFTQPMILINKIGRLLDEDTIYLKSGERIHGWIVNETGDMIFVETGKNLFSFPRDKCFKIKKNALLYYMRQTI